MRLLICCAEQEVSEAVLPEESRRLLFGCEERLCHRTAARYFITATLGRARCPAYDLLGHIEKTTQRDVDLLRLLLCAWGSDVRANQEALSRVERLGERLRVARYG